ncbi:MAG: cystathionine beta-synthase [Myxococcota bacterium]|nr:cystathionine beta-synthase [Myxococcota bacterium]
MRRVYDNILQTMGDTPLVRLNSVTLGLKATVYAKVEFFNPGGSVKDRIALKIIEEAERRGDLKPGGTIVEGTSGNTGAGLAMVAALRGYKTIFVLPDKQSEEKRAALRAWGARVVVTPTNVEPDDPRSYYSVAARLVEETPNSFYANQYHNHDNPVTHYETTGPELYSQLDGKFDVFIAGIGTGGTITGTGRYLKEQNPDIQVVGVDPVGSLYYDYFHTGQLTEPHTYVLEGIGEDFMPSTMDFQYVDDVVRVNDKECFQMTRRLVREEGLYVGGSCGAAVAGALKYLRRVDREGLVAVVLLPDSATKYLSKIFNDAWMRENGFLEPDSGLGTVSDMRAGRDKKRALIDVAPDARVTEVIGVLKLHGISQVPVVLDGKLQGVVFEKRLLERALQRDRDDVPVADVVDASYCTVDAETEVSVLTELFRRFKVAIVIDEDKKPVDIITRIDLIDYISQARTAQ